MALNADNLWGAPISREELPDLLAKEGPDARLVSLDEVLELVSQSSNLFAVWKARTFQERTPFPQVIVGQQKAVEDLFAWASAYMRGYGPLTSQCRVLSTDQFRGLLFQEKPKSWWDLAGGAVGLVLGEVIMHMGRSVLPGEINLALCHGTLSFALLRTAALGAPKEVFESVAQHWEQVRRYTGHTSSVIPLGIVLQIARSMVEFSSMNHMMFVEPERVFSWFRLAATGSRSEVIGEISSAFQNARLERYCANDSDRTAEEKVRAFDEVVPELLRYSSASPTEKAFAIAFLSFWCRPGFFQQVSIIGIHLNEIPEAALWLGAFQVLESMVPSLAVRDGLGWQIARELFRPEEIWEPPRCDVSLSELHVLMRGSDNGEILSQSLQTRLEIELYPGVVTFVRRGSSEFGRQQSKRFEQQSLLEGNEFTPDAALKEAEKAIQMALDLLQIAKTENRSKGGRGRRKKR